MPAEISSDGLTARLPLFSRDGSICGYAVLDAADAEWASQWRWALNIDGYAIRSDGSAQDKRSILLHRELLGLVPGDGLEGDHRNRSRLDDRRENLRAIPKPAQQQNVPGQHGRSSAHRGVSWNTQKQRWHAYTHVSGKTHHLGYFESEDEAAEAARAGRARLLPYAID
jgi:hypothetical protein